MRKKGDVSPTMLLAVLCTALILCFAGMGGASEAPPAGGPLDGCAMFRTFHDINDAWREGNVTNRELVLAKAKAFYEERSGVDPTCSGQALNDLKLEVAEDVYRLKDELLQQDKPYLTSLSVDLARALDRPPVSFEQAQHRAPAAAPTTFARIAKALNEGRIGLKDSVLLRAKLLYAPWMVPLQSEFAPRPGEKVAEKYWTGFNQDVHRVKDLLSPEEKALLRSLDPNLDAIVRSWEGAPEALPNYPQLTQTYTAKGTNYCQIHYTTLKGAPDAVPNVAYVAAVASMINHAVHDETKHFHAAYAEGNGLLQVYCLGSATIPGLDGEWVGVSIVSGNAMSGYMLINSALNSATLKATAYHEYFHGVQFAYSWQSDTWFMEGSAMWAEGYFGACWKDVGDYYLAPDSIFLDPNYPLFETDTVYRKYSTSALVFFFSQKYGGYKFVLTYFQNSVNQNDAIANLTAALRPYSFGDQYVQFLIALYNKKINSIKSYMPNVTLAGTYNTYGQTPTNDYGVYLLGAEFYRLEPPGGPLNQAPFIAWMEPPTGGGTPVGILAPKGSTIPATVQNGRAYIPNSKKEAVYIATDVTYTSSADAAQRPYMATVIAPYIKINKVTAVSPIQEGTTSNIQVYYDLLGTLPGQPFWTTLKITEKAANVIDYATGDYAISVGSNQDLPLYFNTFVGNPTGLYKFTVQLAVPLASWNIPQVKSQGNFSVLVKPSSAGASSSTKGNTIGPALGIAR